MASPANNKVPPSKKGGWGSLLSGAVAGLESRLDTILADDSEASARSRAAEQALKEARASPQPSSLAPPASRDGSTTTGSREGSRTRVNDRLAERLAKATAIKTAASQSVSAVPSRVASPPMPESGRTSIDSKRSAEFQQSTTEVGQLDEEKPVESTEVKENANQNEERQTDNWKKEEPVDLPTESRTLLSSSLPINPAKVSIDSSRPSIEITRDDASSRPSSEMPNGFSKSTIELEAEMARMAKEYSESETQRQEEMQILLEKVDALQSKLQYLAKETVAAAKEANIGSSLGSDTSKLAEKDEKIALLMEEGEKLSKTELRHLQTIRKLRAKGTEDEKAKVELKKKLDRVERSESDLKSRVRKAEVAERQAHEKTKQIMAIETQVEQLRVDRENASELIMKLTGQLKESKDQAERAEKVANLKAAEIDKNKIASLENDLEDTRIEKKLAEDRAVSELQRVREEAETTRQGFSVRELELKNEIASLESKLEAVRSRAEEASAEGNTGSEGNVQLIRQVEMLQSQYAVAKENWESIESSLNARLAAIEKERDEAIRREADVRKKARDVGIKSRKAEDELESVTEKASTLEADIQELTLKSTTLRSKLDNTETALADAKAESERQKKIWDTELAQRVEEEKAKWMHISIQQPAVPSRQESPTNMSRKVSATNVNTIHSSRRPARISSQDLLTLHSSLNERPPSRRSSAFPSPGAAMASSPFDTAPPLIRQESMYSLEEVPISTIENDRETITSTTNLDADFVAPTSPSPDRTIADFVSHTSGAGPSVQLVERMSAAVRRLESEKAAFKDELARLAAQRDAARDDLVGLMREVEEKRASDKRSATLDAELSSLKQRYDGALELLGEREEEVEELRGDVSELKRIYRELVERKVGPEAKG